MARKQIVILGGGTGGTMTANRLRRRFDSDEAEIHVVATGVRFQPEETEGLTGPGWSERAFTFYSPEGLVALHGRSSASTAAGGRGREPMGGAPADLPLGDPTLARRRHPGPRRGGREPRDGSAVAAASRWARVSSGRTRSSARSVSFDGAEPSCSSKLRTPEATSSFASRR